MALLLQHFFKPKETADALRQMKNASLLLKCYEWVQLNKREPTQVDVDKFYEYTNKIGTRAMKEYVNDESTYQITKIFEAIRKHHNRIQAFRHEQETIELLKSEIGYAPYLAPSDISGGKEHNY